MKRTPSPARILSLLLLLTALPTFAAECTQLDAADPAVPNVFTAGAPAVAADVNANFDCLADELGALQAAIKVDASGNVGIGTASPGAPLEISTDNDSAIIINNASDSAGNRIQWNNANAGKWSIGTDSVGGFFIDQYGAGRKLYVNSDGNVGIGTTNPTAPLTVVGDHVNAIHFSGGAETWNIGTNGGNGILYFWDVDRNDGEFAIQANGPVIAEHGYSTAAVDYGEFMIKKNPAEKIAPFEVVALDGGKVTKNTNRSSLFMVTSTHDGLRGGNGMEDFKHGDDRYVVVAFSGQVPVFVEGSVQEGDYLLPSGKNNGKAIAVAADDITFKQYRASLGIVINLIDPSDYDQIALKKPDAGWENAILEIINRKDPEATLVNLGVGVK